MPRMHRTDSGARGNGFPFRWREYSFDRCRAKAGVSAVSAVEAGLGVEISTADPISHFYDFFANLVFLDLIGFCRGVVFEVVERQAVDTVAIELSRQTIQTELDAVDGVEGALRQAGLVIQHQHAAAFEAVDAIDAAIDHHIL